MAKSKIGIDTFKFSLFLFSYNNLDFRTEPDKDYGVKFMTELMCQCPKATFIANWTEKKNSFPQKSKTLTISWSVLQLELHLRNHETKHKKNVMQQGSGIDKPFYAAERQGIIQSVMTLYDVVIVP